jgi:tetratricopeptide (TPR) repeat protein
MQEEGTGSLAKAILAYRQALMEFTRERVPDRWAQTQLNLGLALTVIAEHDAGTGRLEEAVAAFHEVLEVWKREDHPTEWENAQVGLAEALNGLGLRGGGAEKFAEAAGAYHKALTALTLERDRLEWATTQYFLGVTLERHAKLDFEGERLLDATRLKDAIVAFRVALQESPKDPLPIWHAIAQRKLAVVEDVLRLHGTADSDPNPGDQL